MNDLVNINSKTRPASFQVQDGRLIVDFLSVPGITVRQSNLPGLIDVEYGGFIRSCTHEALFEWAWWMANALAVARGDGRHSPEADNFSD